MEGMCGMATRTGRVDGGRGGGALPDPISFKNQDDFHGFFCGTENTGAGSEREQEREEGEGEARNHGGVGPDPDLGDHTPGPEPT